MAFQRDELSAMLPEVLADIVLDYVRPEYELAELQDRLKAKIMILGEIDPEIFTYITEFDLFDKTGMFSIKWILHLNEGRKTTTIIYDPHEYEISRGEDETEYDIINTHLIQEYKDNGCRTTNSSCDLCEKSIYTMKFVIADLTQSLISIHIDQDNEPDPVSTFDFSGEKFIECCYDCADKFIDEKTPILDKRDNKTVTKSDIKKNPEENKEYFINATQYSDIIKLFRFDGRYMQNNCSYYYYRGLNRPKFITSSISTFDTGFRDGIVVVDEMIEMNSNPYKLVIEEFAG